MKILGIDPGLVYTGWGVIEKTSYDNMKYIDSGIIGTKKIDPLQSRLKTIYLEVSNLVHSQNPRAVAMEEVFVNMNPESSKKLIMARTTALLACCNNGLTVNEFAPTTVKKNITGNGRSHKEQVHVMIQKILNLSIDKKTYDSIDALALAMCQAFIDKSF